MVVNPSVWKPALALELMGWGETASQAQTNADTVISRLLTKQEQVPVRGHPMMKWVADTFEVSWPQATYALATIPLPTGRTAPPTPSPGTLRPRYTGPDVIVEQQWTVGEAITPIDVSAWFSYAGSGPLTYELVPDQPGPAPLPDGVGLATAAGIVAGTPTEDGTFHFSVRADGPEGHDQTPQITAIVAAAAPAVPPFEMSNVMTYRNVAGFHGYIQGFIGSWSGDDRVKQLSIQISQGRYFLYFEAVGDLPQNMFGTLVLDNGTETIMLFNGSDGAGSTWVQYETTDHGSGHVTQWEWELDANHFGMLNDGDTVQVGILP